MVRAGLPGGMPDTGYAASPMLLIMDVSLVGVDCIEVPFHAFKPAGSSEQMTSSIG
jgi:hypothetical protein